MTAVVTCFLIGGTRVLARCADQLVASGVRIEGVFTAEPVATAWADAHDVPVLDPHADLAAALTATEVDYLFSIVNFRILPGPVLALPRVAAINFHDGPLPRYSGSNVAAWALYEGAGRHAATWHRMTEAVDAGPVLLERWFPVRTHSTALSLTYETAEVGIALFADLVPYLLRRALPEPVDTADRGRRFYHQRDRIAGGGLIHAGTSAVEAERIAKALDYGTFPNPLGVPALVTAQGAVFTRQIRRIPREDPPSVTVTTAVTDSAITLSTPDGDLLLSDFTATDGSALSGRAVAQRLGIAPGRPLPAAPPGRLAAIAEAQGPLRRHESWWKARLTDLRPAPLPAEDFSAASAHYGRYELAYLPRSWAETVTVIRAFLAVLAERMEAPSFDFAWSASSAPALAEATHGLAVARVPVRFDAAAADELAARLDEATARHGYATDLEVRLGLAYRPVGADGPTFTRIAVLQRHPDDEAATEPDTEIALLCLHDGPPTVFVRETAMSADEALEFAERVEDLALGAMLLGTAAPMPAPASAPAPADGGASATTGPAPTDGSAPAPATEPLAAGPTDSAGPPDVTAHPEPAPEPAAPVPTVLDLVAATVAARPDAVAVRSGARRIDYATLDAWADAIAAHLYDQGLGAGSVVGLLTERGPDLVPAMLGILRVGAAFLPLDPNYPVDRLRRYAQVAECDLILADEHSLACGEAVGPVLPIPGPDGSALAVPPTVTGADLAYVLFTSGSTGEPKGVEIGHAALANFLTGIGERLDVTGTDTVLAHTTVAFDISLLELLLPLTVGATVTLASRAVARDPHRLADLIGEVTVAQATPSMWRLLLETGWTPTSRLTVLSGGEALVPATAQQLHGTARALWNLYGPTEATIWASAHRVESVGAFLPLGEPLPNLALHVLDADLEPADTGELYLSGVGLARGYVNRPDRTAEVFLTHPVSGQRLYRTGDTVRRHADGAIEWLGRADSQVKVRGNRIEPAEIERVLAEYPGVTAAAVIAVAFEGRGEPRLTAYLVGERTLVKAELDTFVGGRLPEYMVPDAYVRLDAMPLTDNGKIARNRLPRPDRHSIIRTGVPSVAPAAPPAAAAATPEPAAAPEPTIAPEQRIARVFAAVLGHDEFLVTDNFFDLGGDSANVTRAALALTEEFGVAVSPPAIFATGTPERLAELLQPAPGTLARSRPDTTGATPEQAVVAAAEAVVAATTDTAAERTVDAAPDPAHPAPAGTTGGPRATTTGDPAAPGTVRKDPSHRPAPADASGTPAPDTVEEPLAVIGLACRFPGAATPDEFWANLAEGVSSVGDAPTGHRGWGHLWSAADEVPTGWVDRVEHFDAARFQLTDREARRLDPLQRLLLSVTDEALESCGHTAASLGTATGVFVGTIASDFPELVAGSIGAGDPHVATGTAVSMVANRLSHAFNWSGPSFAVDTACSSSLVALHQAAMHLRAGEVDAAVVGAANLVLTPTKTRSFLRNGMLSPTGVCRTFDDDADGYVRGEGCGVVVLKRLVDAERDGDPVLAVVRGSAVNHTGAAGFLTAPSSTAQQAVIRSALRRAGVEADGVGYIEAHGTGTQLGDLIELEALQAALGAARRGTVAVGSVKTNIGHLEPAAGIAGLIKTILALQADRIPPSAHLTFPNRAFRFENSPLFVPDRLVPWAGPRVAGVSSFGFGGVNAHAVLAAAPSPTRVPARTGTGLLTLSAGSEEGLRTLADRLVHLLRSPYCPPLGWICVASRQRPAATYRLACVVDTVEQLDDKLMLFLARAEGTRNLYTGIVPTPSGRTLPPLGDAPGRDALDTAARRFVAGDGLVAEERAPVRFPTAPHEEKHLWLTPASTAGRLPAAGVPATTPPGSWTEHPEAREHVVLGDPTLPGSGYPGKVAELLGRDAFTLRDLTFRATVRPPATLTAERHGSRVTFRDGTTAVVCDLEVADPEPADPTLTPPAATVGLTPVDLDGMYRDFDRNGLRYGPSFRCVRQLSTADGVATGTLRVDAGPDAGPVDARLLDGAFQVALAACGAQGLYVPFTVSRLTVWGPLTGEVRVHARRDRGSAPDAGLLTASLVVLDGDRPVLTARGVTWRRISPAPPPTPPTGTGAHDRARFDGTTPTGVPGHRGTPPGSTPVHGADGNGRVPAASGPGTTAAAPLPVNGTAVSRPVNGAGDLGRTLARWIAEGLETDVETLELDRPLEAQGLDSMLAVSLAQDIRTRLGVDIPVTLLLEVGTVENLARELRDSYGVTAVPGAASTPGAVPPVPGGGSPAGVPVAPTADAPPVDLPATAAPAYAPAVPAPIAPAPDPVGSAAVAPAAVAPAAVTPVAVATSTAPDRHDIAIVGIDGVFPNASNLDELWEVLTRGEDCLREVPKSRWDIDDYYSDAAEPGTVYLRRAGFVDDLTDFDAPFFRISPAEAQWIDPQQRHLIQSAWRALEDAGLSGRTDGRSTGVFVGASYQHYRDMVVGDVVQTAAGLGNHNAILANRVSYFLDLSGPSMTIDTLCSSSLVALHTAVRSIRNGECDQAIVAGVHLAMSPQYFQLGSRLRSFSATGASRAFDAGADGFVPGEGVVTVVVKPLVDAVRDGDRVRGVIRGSAVNHGGRTSGLTVPSSAAQREVIVAALRDAGVGPDGIGMVEAHGTGTSLGDPIEVEGLTRAWRGFTSRTQFCAIGSLKSNIGHLEPAAGLAGLVKVLLSLERGVVPATLHVVRPNDHIRFEDSPFFVADKPVSWPRVAGVPRRAAVSAFGMGGVNAHVIVEEAPLPAVREVVPQQSYVVKVSAASEDGVRRLADGYARLLSGVDSSVLGDVGFTANVGRASHRFRVAVQGSDGSELAAGLNAVAGGDRPVARLSNQPPSSVFLFSGQGSQYPGMAAGLYATEPVFRAAFDECAELVASGGDVPLREVVFGDRGDELVQTRFAQVGIVAVQVGLVRLLESWGVRPGLVVGHSVGELTAAWAAGVFGLGELLRLAVVRGGLMQAQPADGAMAVVFADAASVEAVLPSFPGVEIAAFNAPRSVTISGPAGAVEAFGAGSGLRTQRLTVSHAFHSAAMAGAVDPFAQAFGQAMASPPRIGFASTVTGGWHDARSVADGQVWGSAIRRPVRFAQAVEAAYAAGGRVFWEIGAHPVLTGLARATLTDTDLTWLPTLRRDHDDQTQLHTAITSFYNQGHGDLDWAGIHHGKGHRTTTIPTYPFERRELSAPRFPGSAARRRPEPEASVPAAGDGAVGHPLFDRHYEH
ncbi:polyketide synthase [Micromonospora humida]|uniref:Amino acid adenylation domain-containing protein n=1 Tax=Micromonospora humida TaxID=2809018 RepID=A0ABS2IZ21_9ACTN|nr:polyketide synthase [Micromonospora humida]MBM7078648.1 amino acid adenylation domain-containing protein [Micromonospora humida]